MSVLLTTRGQRGADVGKRDEQQHVPGDEAQYGRNEAHGVIKGNQTAPRKQAAERARGAGWQGHGAPTLAFGGRVEAHAGQRSEQ